MRKTIIAMPIKGSWLFKIGAIKLLSPSLRHTAVVECLDYEIYERYFKIEKGDIVVDVGTAIGEFTIPAAIKVSNEGLVLAIEPEPRNFIYLNMNVELNRLRNVKLCRKAVANYKGVAKFYVFQRGVTDHTLYYRGDNVKVIEVEVDTLDSIICDFGLDKVDFLKIDVEGAEVRVLEGARKTLNFVRKIVVECHSLRNTRIVTQILISKGFKVKLHNFVVYGIKT